MVSSNPVDKLSDEYFKNHIKCVKESKIQCQGCGQTYYMDDYFEHQRKLQEDFGHILNIQDSLNQKLKLFISQLSPDAILDLIKEIYEFKMKSDEIKKTFDVIKQNLEKVIENGIEQLKLEIEQLKLELEKMTNNNPKKLLQEKSCFDRLSVQSDNRSETIRSPLMSLISQNKINHLQSVDATSTNSATLQREDSGVLSHLLLRQMSPAIIDMNENELDLTNGENGTYREEGEDEEVGFDLTSKSTRKIRLANSIVNYLKGPFKVMVDGTMHMVDVMAQGTHISEGVVKVVKEELIKQKEMGKDQQNTGNSLKPAFAEITSDWIYEGENSDRGFSSPSIWMRDPQGRRILVKTQEHPLCAANEWLAYALGQVLGLPVNEVQIALYKNDLVTLHTDVSQADEKTITFMDLPKQIKNQLLTGSALQCMDLFDHIIQNVDRNPRNILITMPNSATFDDISKMKIHLIDHSSCFGMGKLNAISIVASKFHSQHLAVVKFNPIEQAKKFELYLSKLPKTNRVLISKILNRFAAVTDDQFNGWITEIQNLLSSGQYNRIYNVLYRQRDIVRRYTIQWGIYSRSSSSISNKTNRLTSEMNDLVTYF